MFDFDTIIDRTNTLAIKYDLAKERNKPEDALSLWVADMDFKTAPCILKAIEERAHHGIFGYSRPDERYYEALKNWFKSRHNFDIKKEWVVNTPGVCYALACAVKAYTNEGDSVLIQKPVYYPFFNTINTLGRKAVNSPLVMSEGVYKIDFEDFEDKIVKNDVKLFLFCSPHNPGGRVWTRDELERISDICLRHNVIVVSDEIHSDITFGDNKHTVFALLSEKAAENTVICTSPSKTFNLAGLQFSNIIIPSKKLRDAFVSEINRTGYDEPSLMGTIAATAAYSQGGEWFDEVKAYIWDNICFAQSYLEQNCPKIKAPDVQGTYLLWLDFTAFNLTDEVISSRILNKAKVWLDDGSMFGSEGKKYQRINCATPRAVLEEALKRICNEFKND